MKVLVLIASIYVVIDSISYSIYEFKHQKNIARWNRSMFAWNFSVYIY